MAAGNGGPRNDGNDRRDKGGKGGKGRGQREASPKLGRIESRKVKVGGKPGVAVWKLSKVDIDSHKEVSSSYEVEFDGFPAITCLRLAEARERANEAPPEHPVAADVAVPAEAVQTPVEAEWVVPAA